MAADSASAELPHDAQPAGCAVLLPICWCETHSPCRKRPGNLCWRTAHSTSTQVHSDARRLGPSGRGRSTYGQKVCSTSDLNRRLLGDVALPHAVRGLSTSGAPQPQTVLQNLLGLLVLHVHHALAAVGCSAVAAQVSASGMHAGNTAAGGGVCYFPQIHSRRCRNTLRPIETNC